MDKTSDRLTEIARIGKVHGLEGFVKVRAENEAVPFIEEGALLYLENRRGDLIPTRITEVRVEEKRNMRSFFVKFDRISDRTEAEAFQDTPLYTVSPADDQKTEQEMESDTLRGFEVVDDTGLVGVVSGIMQNPAHPIIEVEFREDPSRMLLVPWVDEYIQSVDKENRKLVCQNLDQLIDI